MVSIFVILRHVDIIFVSSVQYNPAMSTCVREPIRKVPRLHVVLRVGLLRVRLVTQRADKGGAEGGRVHLPLYVLLQEGGVVRYPASCNISES